MSDPALPSFDNKPVLLELQYLPITTYFSVIARASRLILEKHEHFIKQTYRNRTYINTSQGSRMLVVPVSSSQDKPVISEMRIDYRQKWLTNHWRAIRSAYGKAPYFEFYADELESTLCRPYTFLYDLNLALLTLCLNWLRLKLPVEETLTYQPTAPEGVIDLRNLINAKNLALRRKLYEPVPYTQVFGNMFVNDLSLVDLIFCKGPDARQILMSGRPDGMNI